MAHQVQEIGRVLAVMDREGGIETDLVRVSPQQPGADRVKGAGPAEPIGRPGGAPPYRAAPDPLRAPGALRSSSPRKGHQQTPARIRAADDQMCDAMRERARLAGAGASDDEK